MVSVTEWKLLMEMSAEGADDVGCTRAGDVVERVV